MSHDISFTDRAESTLQARELEIRQKIFKLTNTPNVSSEYPLLSIEDTCFLLSELDRARGKVRVISAEPLRLQYNGYNFVVTQREEKP